MKNLLGMFLCELYLVGDYSEILITLNKPDELNDKQFDQRISEMSDMIIVMKNIIESDM